MNSQIFNFFMTFVSNVAKMTKHFKSIIIIIIINKNTFSYKEECHILNQFIITNKNISYIYNHLNSLI